MTETACRFGEGDRLSGMLGRPDAGDAGMARPAVLFLSAGLLHKVGPYRLHVDLARLFNTLGFPTLRFDLGGIGDSRPPVDPLPAEQSAVSEVQAAIDFAEQALGVHHFILFGLCRGAEVAHHSAIADPRVVGLILLDGYIFPTPLYYLFHYVPRLLSLRKLAGFLGRRLGNGTTLDIGREREHSDAAANLWSGPGLPRSRVAKDIQTLCDRGVRQLCVFTGGAGDCSYEKQFWHAFPEVEDRDKVTVRFLREADHMYILARDRLKLSRLMTQWLEATFAARVATGEPADRQSHCLPDPDSEWAASLRVPSDASIKGGTKWLQGRH